jgi:VanZ family protein
LLTAPWRKLALITLLAGAAVGWFDEWHQSFTPGRKGLDVYDWMADVLGSLAAVPLARLGLRWLALRGGRA